MEDSCGSRILQSWEDMLASKSEVRWVIDFGPRKVRCAGRAYHDSLVNQVLNCNVEKLIDSPGRNQLVHRTEEPRLDFRRKGCDPNVRPAELITRDCLAHANHAAIANDDFHRFVPPFRINDHGDWRGSGNGGPQDLWVAEDVRVKNHEIAATQPCSRHPKRINIVGLRESWIEKELESLQIPSISRANMAQNLFAL